MVYVEFQSRILALSRGLTHEGAEEMPIEALTKSELESTPASSGHEEYVAFLRGARAGSGGTLEVAKEKVTRQTIKNRLRTAAQITGREIRFQRSSKDSVVFQVVG